MSTNDVLALDANLSQWKSTRMTGLHKDLNAFEYYCLEHFLRDWIASDDDLQRGMVGGSKDGGVDALYFFVNRELVTEDTVPDPKTAIRTDLFIFQMKEGDGFSPVQVDKLNFFTEDLLDLTRPESGYHSGYRGRLLELMQLFKNTYKKIIGGAPEFHIEYVYISKKDAAENSDCRKSEAKLRAKVESLIGKVGYKFEFINAAKLWNRVKARPKKTKTLTWAAQPLETPEGYVGLVGLPDYYSFLQDDAGELNQRIFESNVRGFWPSTSINKQIQATLESPKAEFWLLNNGATILAAEIKPGGFKQHEVVDPQIVNGLQTSRLIFDYYKKFQSFPSSDIRRILVRIVTTQDKSTRDQVIRATNSQNKMPDEALRATDQIHRQIEELFLRFGLYYDRRRGQYKDEGKPVAQIVSVVQVLQAMLAIALKRPDEARGRPRDYFKQDELYNKVFAEGAYDLNVYLRCSEILRRINQFIDGLGLEPIHERNIRFYLCFYSACAVKQNPYLPAVEILKVEARELSDDFLKECYERIRTSYDLVAYQVSENGERDYDAVGKGVELLKVLSAELKKRFRGQKKRKRSEDTSAEPTTAQDV